jgi:hypothetical protein
MAEEKSLEEILWQAKALRRRADELIKAFENLMEKYERLRPRTGHNYKASADGAGDFSDGAKESSQRHKRDLSQNRRAAHDAAENVQQGKNRRDAGRKK